MSTPSTVTITRQSGYQFLVDFGIGSPALIADEGAPLGQGTGPAPEHLLLAGIANCLAASLMFALQKFKQDPGALKATATAELGRNEANRLRIVGVNVALELPGSSAELQHLDRVLAQFEEFCTVTMSVRQGIPVAVRVSDGTGAVLKG